MCPRNRSVNQGCGECLEASRKRAYRAADCVLGGASLEEAVLVVRAVHDRAAAGCGFAGDQALCQAQNGSAVAHTVLHTHRHIHDLEFSQTLPWSDCGMFCHSGEQMPGMQIHSLPSIRANACQAGTCVCNEQSEPYGRGFRVFVSHQSGAVLSPACHS